MVRRHAVPKAGGTFRGGGYWESATQLRLNGWITYAKGRHKSVYDLLPPALVLAEYEGELGDLGSGVPTTVIDLEHLAPPPV